MNTNRIFLAFTVALLGAVAAKAQSRTWSFAKDTVYEWKAGGDSVTYANSGPDSLKFDSVWMEIIKPVSSNMNAWFKHDQGELWVRVVEGSRNTQGNLNNLAVPPGQNKRLHQFSLQEHRNVVAKQAAIVTGDTLLARLVFSAANGRGRDTLMVKGKQDLASAILSGSHKGVRRGEAKGGYDPRGRLMPRSPQERKGRGTPLLTPVH